MPDSYKRKERPEFEPYQRIDLTTFFDKVDFGVELTGDWQKDEQKLIDLRLKELAGKRKQDDSDDVSKLDINSLDSE